MKAGNAGGAKHPLFAAQKTPLGESLFAAGAAARPQKGPTARAWAEIDLAALRHNAAVLQNALPAGCLLMPVLKANAYGHGLVLTGRALGRAGVRAFAVATLE